MLQRIDTFDFHKNKYGSELLVDFIRLESLEKYFSDNKPHVLTYFDITVISDGHGHFQLDDALIPLSQGTVIFSCPGQIRKWNHEKVPKGYVLIFEEEFLSLFFNDRDFVRQLHIFSTVETKPGFFKLNDEYDHMCRLMEAVECELPFYRERGQHVLRALLYQVLAYLDHLFRNANPGKISKQDDYLNKFFNILSEDGYKNRPVSFYADQMNITPGYLNDLIKGKLKISVKRFIQDKTLHQAKRLLLYTNSTISEIAWQLDFQDTSYFIRTFKKEVGYTPKSFREMNNT